MGYRNLAQELSSLGQGGAFISQTLAQGGSGESDRFVTDRVSAGSDVRLSGHLVSYRRRCCSTFGVGNETVTSAVSSMRCRVCRVRVFRV